MGFVGRVSRMLFLHRIDGFAQLEGHRRPNSARGLMKRVDEALGRPLTTLAVTDYRSTKEPQDSNRQSVVRPTNEYCGGHPDLGTVSSLDLATGI
jgi:hypothetical protein